MIDGDYAPIGGREGQAAAMKLMSWHVALGRGDPAWDAVPRTGPLWQAELTPDAAQARALVSEIGRRTADEVAFVRPDPNGEIRLPGNSRWTRTPDGAVSPHLYVRVTFDYDDAAGETIRELGLIAGCAAIDGLPPGLRWFAPAQMAAAGHLMQLRRFAVPFERTGGTEHLYHFVQSF